CCGFGPALRWHKIAPALRTPKHTCIDGDQIVKWLTPIRTKTPSGKYCSFFRAKLPIAKCPTSPKMSTSSGLEARVRARFCVCSRPSLVRLSDSTLATVSFLFTGFFAEFIHFDRGYI